MSGENDDVAAAFARIGEKVDALRDGQRDFKEAVVYLHAEDHRDDPAAVELFGLDSEYVRVDPSSADEPPRRAGDGKD